MMSTVLQDLRSNSSGTCLTLCSPLSSTNSLLMLLVSSLHRADNPVLRKETDNGTTGFDDDIQRRDSMHALINSLPDAHYATLRAIILV